MSTVLHVLLYRYVEVYPDLTDVRHAGQYFGTLTELVNGDAPVFNKRSEGGDSVRQPTGCSEPASQRRELLRQQVCRSARDRSSVVARAMQGHSWVTFSALWSPCAGVVS